MIHCFSSLPSLEKHAGGRLLSLLIISLCLADRLIFIITLYGSTTLLFLVSFGIVYYEKFKVHVLNGKKWCADKKVSTENNDYFFEIFGFELQCIH